MSLGEEVRTEQTLKRLEWEIARKKVLKRDHTLVDRGCWATQDGRIIPVKNMESQHIRNCIYMLHRNMPYYSDEQTFLARRCLDMFERELIARHEAASHCGGNGL